MFKRVLYNNIRKLSHHHKPYVFHDKIQLITKSNRFDNHEGRINNIENLIKSQNEIIDSIQLQLRYMQNFNGTVLSLVLIPFFIMTYGKIVLELYKDNDLKPTDIPL